MDIQRPKRPNRTRRNELLLRLDDAENAALDALAADRNVARSEVIRALILEAAPPPKRRRARTVAAGTGR